MFIAVIGDQHGNIKNLIKLLHHIKQAHPTVTTILQVGDLIKSFDKSFFACLQSHLDFLNLTFYFTNGNHDDLRNLRAPTTMKLDKSILFCPTGSIITIDNRSFMFVGGAYDIKSGSGHSCLKDDNVIGQADVVVAHDTIPKFARKLVKFPLFISRWIWPRDYKHKKYLASIISKVQPKLIVHGHYHKFKIQQHKDIINISLGQDGQAFSKQFYLI